MGRSRRGTGSGFSRSSSGPSSAPPPRAQAPPPAQHQMPAGGGMPMGMGMRGPGLMGTMAAAAGGSMLGNAVSHHMFGAPQPTSSQGVQEMKQVMAESPCAVQFDMYAKCMEHNGNNADACSWAWDSVSQCRTQAMQQQQYQQQAMQQQQQQQQPPQQGGGWM